MIRMISENLVKSWKGADQKAVKAACLKSFFAARILCFFCMGSFLFYSATLQAAETPAQNAVVFTSSNLPIIIIDTHGQQITDSPKIIADMGIIDNGAGQRNNVSDPFNNYDGKIAIEIRGSSSQMFPKKQYAVETRDSLENDLEVSLLGLPAEEDWILYAPYTDKTLMRDVLAYHLSNEMGRYASRSRFCELVLNGDYKGVYVLLEKVKRDKKRVNVAKLDSSEISGDDLTGGYILKIDKLDGEEVGGWYSVFPPYQGSSARIYYQYHYPKPTEIAPEQQKYIKDFILNFEYTLFGPNYFDPAEGYAKIINEASFVDHFILNEIGKNVDGYRLSAYLYKDIDSKDSMLYAGPIWDCNLAFGNADYYACYSTSGWQVNINYLPEFEHDGFKVPFWWERLMDDHAFVEKVSKRWSSLRSGILDADHITNYIDSLSAALDEAQKRNYERWPILGHYVWPNHYIGQTYADEIIYLKFWIKNRLLWMDSQMLDQTPPQPPKKLMVTGKTSSSVSLSWEAATDNMGIDAYDIFAGDAKVLTTSQTTAKVVNLAENTTYTFTVQSRDFGGNVSSNNPQVNATTNPFTEQDGIFAVRTSATPAIDGIEDEFWSGHEIQQIAHLVSGSVSSAVDLSATFKTAWDAAQLYVFVKVTDDVKIRDSGASLSADDGVELYIDSDNSKSSSYDNDDFKYRFAYNDTTVYERMFNAVQGVQFKMIDNSDGYDVEISIPWTTLRLSPLVNALVGFELQINDDDNGNVRDAKISWWGTVDVAYNDPSKLGVIKLKDTTSSFGGGFQPKRFFLKANYPNPFNSGTTIEYHLAETDHVQLAVFNLLGQVVKTLVDREQPAGWHIVRFEGIELSSGVYFYRIRAAKGHAAVRRMLLLK